LYVVLSGSVRIVKDGVEIAILGKGACFGEMAVLDGAPRSADASVSDEAVLLRISSEEFYEALAEDPRLIQNVIGVLTRRLRDANARIARTSVT
jgi:CRP-like cAMP-binding protein